MILCKNLPSPSTFDRDKEDILSLGYIVLHKSHFLWAEGKESLSIEHHVTECHVTNSAQCIYLNQIEASTENYSQ